MKNEWARLLKEYRSAADVTQVELAKQFNVAPNTVSRWENGLYDIDANVTWFLAEFFFGATNVDHVSQAIRYLSGLQTQQDAANKQPRSTGE